MVYGLGLSLLDTSDALRLCVCLGVIPLNSQLLSSLDLFWCCWTHLLLESSPLPLGVTVLEKASYRFAGPANTLDGIDTYHTYYGIYDVLSGPSFSPSETKTFYPYKSLSLKLTG
eukprot:scaffold35233_cov59-Cyclotella_meneghiniana.AAC.5